MESTATAKKGMSHSDIKAELVRRGVKLIDIAYKANVTLPVVSQSLSDKYKVNNHKIRPFIAEAIGMSVEEIWPESGKKGTNN